MSFLESFSLVWSAFVLIAYLMVMFTIVGDIFRDEKAPGALKAMWIVLLIAVPLVTAVVYLIWHGRGMSARAAKARQKAHDETAAYIRHAAGATSPAEEIAAAGGLRDSGVITAAEFETLKAKALA